MSQKEYCSMCAKDAVKFCPSCGKNFCGKHFGIHTHPTGRGTGIG